MNLAELFIRRPVMTTLLTLGTALFGVMCYPLLPVNDLPNVDYPVIEVSASLSGASAETMASAVAIPLEKQFSTISGLDSMSSSSSLGRTRITMNFSLDRDIDSAAQDVQAAISQTMRRLPSDMPSPPSYSKVNPADQPILYLALTSATLPLSALDRYAQTVLAQKMSTVNGVAQVQVHGSQKYAVRIRPNPNLLAAWGVGLDEIQAAIQAANVNQPTGTLDGSHQALVIQTEGQLLKAESYRSIIVAYRDGAPVRLGDLAEVQDSVEDDKTAAWFCNSDSQRRAIVMAVLRQPGTNTVEVAESVKKLLPNFMEQLPASVGLSVIFDRSESIKESVRDVKFTMILTLCLVVLVIFFFLRSFRATIIPALSLPMSLVGTFIIIYLFGYSLDNLSLMALTLAIGFVVDDAIVMLENIFRHMEMGKDRLTAALDGSKEIVFTIISMTLSLSAVFIPLIFMGGLVGRLFREFAVTIGVAVLVSGVISLTLIPMLASRFLRSQDDADMEAHKEHKHSWFLRLYELTLRWSVRHWLWVFLLSLGVLWFTGYLFTTMPKGFLPSEDQGRAIGQIEMAQGISFSSLIEHQQAIASIVQREPEMDVFMSRASGNTGMILIRLKPREIRKMTCDQIVEKLRKQLADVPGAKIVLQNPPPIQVGGRMSKGQYQYTLQGGANIDELYDCARDMEKALSELPQLIDVSSDMQIRNPQINVVVDRDKAATLRVSVAQIESALYSAYGPRQISTIYAPEDQYSVLLELQPEYRRNSAALSLLHVRSGTGQLVPLSDLVRMERGAGPLSVNHTGQLPSVTISFNLKQGVSLSQAVESISQAANANLSNGVTASFQGTAKAFQDSMKGMNILLILTIVVIYIVLGILYESFIHPITILTALPFAGLGALLSLWLCNIELSLYAFVGIIMLVGIVKKNGIMMIDFAIAAQRNENKSPEDAIIEACLVRFRPIMMTTFAALMAGIPIAVGWGAGGEARRPLGVAVVGGLLFSQLLTLYVTPVFYVCMEKLRTKLSRKVSQDAAPSIPSVSADASVSS